MEHNAVTARLRILDAANKSKKIFADSANSIVIVFFFFF